MRVHMQRQVRESFPALREPVHAEQYAIDSAQMPVQRYLPSVTSARG